MKKLIVLVFSLMLIIGIAGCNSSSAPEKTDTSATPPTSSTSETSNPAPAQTTTYKIGDTVTIDNYKITVNSAEIVEPDSFNKPLEENTHFLFVDATVENIGSEPASISSMLMFDLVDKDGRSQNVFIHSKQKGTLNGELGAGRKMSGQIVYEIPKENKASDYEFIFIPNFMESGQVIFKLTK